MNVWGDAGGGGGTRFSPEQALLPSCFLRAPWAQLCGRASLEDTWSMSKPGLFSTPWKTYLNPRPPSPSPEQAQRACFVGLVCETKITAQVSGACWAGSVRGPSLSLCTSELTVRMEMYICAVLCGSC